MLLRKLFGMSLAVRNIWYARSNREQCSHRIPRGDWLPLCLSALRCRRDPPARLSPALYWHARQLGSGSGLPVANLKTEPVGETKRQEL